MDEALRQVGLPVHCAGVDDQQMRCEAQGLVKPDKHYGGWYKSKLLRGHSTPLTKRWFCPEHARQGKELDDRFYQRYATPETADRTVIVAGGIMAVPESDGETTVDVSGDVEELYKLLD